MKKLFLLIFLVWSISSCGIPMGDRVDSKNLSVYYLDGIAKQDAINFAKYWRDNGFVGERKQTIQLELEQGIIFIKLIENEIYRDEPISITEEAMLQDIERDLSKEVFNKEVEIVITDNTFRPMVKRKL